MYDISPTNRHLLVSDAHASHVILEVAKLAMSSGLDLLTFPSFTSHELYPLDVSNLSKQSSKLTVTNGHSTM